MKSMLCTHLVWIDKSGQFLGQVIGSYMRVFDRTFTTNTKYLRGWQRIPQFRDGRKVEVTPLPLNEQRVITEDEPREYICAQDGCSN